jgi:PAS domain S-box-containing protein
MENLDRQIAASGIKKNLAFQKAKQVLYEALDELIEVEEALLESEQRFRMVADMAPVMIWQSGRDKLCHYFNKRWLDFTGRTMRQEKDDGWAEGVYPDDFKRCLETYSAAFDARQNFTMEYRLRRYDGEYRWMLDTGVPIFSPDGDFKGYIGSCVDITDQKLTEAMMRESRAQFASIIEAAMDAIITIDSDYRVILFNAAAEKLFGLPATEAIGKPIDLFIPERFRPSHREHIRRLAETSVTSRSMGSLGTISGLRAEGKEFPFEASISQVEVDSKKLFTVIIRDITSRIQDEAKLREQAALLDLTPDAILVRDLEDHVLYWNKGAERLFGWTAEEAVGRKAQELHLKESDDYFYEAKRILLEKGDWSGEFRLATKSGEKLDVESRWVLVRDQDGNPKSVLVINTDITEKKILEAQVIRAQRLESVGTLAAGIAHDMGNILSPILLATQLLRMNFQFPEKEKSLSMIETNVRRGSELLKQILGFSREAGGKSIVLQPRHIIKDIEAVIRETFPKSIELRCHVSRELWLIKSDATRLHQVLLNLCINARDAMQQGGVLTMSAENIVIDQVYAATSGRVKAGRYILIEIADTGSGIADEQMEKIFEPYFTTKGPARGTGLGLANVARIIKQHAGFIDLRSEVGRGTRFKLFLPAAEAKRKKRPEPEQLKLPNGRGEMILAVDDEATVLEIMAKTLEAYGYRVLTARDGVEAISVYVQNRDEIELVLLDMVMPGMDGPTTIRTLKKLSPGIKFIASSANSESLGNAGRLGVKAFLLKPYTTQDLLSLLANLLTQSRANRA